MAQGMQYLTFRNLHLRCINGPKSSGLSVGHDASCASCALAKCRGSCGVRPHQSDSDVYKASELSTTFNISRL